MGVTLFSTDAALATNTVVTGFGEPGDRALHIFDELDALLEPMPSCGTLAVLPGTKESKGCLIESPALGDCTYAGEAMRNAVVGLLPLLMGEDAGKVRRAAWQTLER